MIKLIASDLDGTLLLGGAQTLPDGICDQIKELTRRGILFVAASGRQYANLRRLFAPVQDDIAYICENGCMVFYKGKQIYKAVLDHELGQEMLREIMKQDTMEALLSGENTSYLQPKKDSYRVLVEDVVKNNVTVVDDILHTEEPYFKISFYEEKGVKDCYKTWNDKFGDRAAVVTSGHEWLDMMPKGENKGNALRVLLEHTGIPKAECLAFGDNYNDIEMLNTVGHSCAVATAKPAVKEVCKYTVDTVGKALEEFLNDHK